MMQFYVNQDNYQINQEDFIFSNNYQAEIQVNHQVENKSEHELLNNSNYIEDFTYDIKFQNNHLEIKSPQSKYKLANIEIDEYILEEDTLDDFELAEYLFREETKVNNNVEIKIDPKFILSQVSGKVELVEQWLKENTVIIEQNKVTFNGNYNQDNFSNFASQTIEEVEQIESNQYYQKKSQEKKVTNYDLEEKFKVSGKIDLVINWLRRAESPKLDDNFIAQSSFPLGTPDNLPKFDQEKIDQYQLQPTEENQPTKPTESQEKTPTGNDKESEIEVREKLIQFLLNNASLKYPYLVNSTDEIIIKLSQYQPQDFNFYSDLEMRFDGNIIRTNEAIPIVSYWNFSKFNDGFYWILEGNRMVIETTGIHGGFRYQGFSSQTNYRQLAKAGTTFWGVQTAWAFPPIIGNLTGIAERESPQQTSITLLALEVINPAEAKIDKYEVTFTGIIPGSDIAISLDDISKAETYSLSGGGEYFENLDANNAPVFLQGFKTVNLKPLLDDGVRFRQGEIVPEENLNKAGLKWGDFFTGEGFSFTPDTDPLTQKKFPRLQLLKLGDDVNNDLVTILSNPFITERERELAYLNSLDWINFGPQNIQVENFDTVTEENDWYRFLVSYSHNQSLLYYHPEKIELNYTNIFANPGLSLTLTGFNEIDSQQTINSSIGSLLGLLFEFINPNNLDESLEEAKKINEELKPISSLETKADSNQRRAMNTRLNLTLSNTSTVTNLHQVSGSWTFNSKITPEDSFLMQIRSGLYQRSIQFYSQNYTEWSKESPTIFYIVREIDLFPITYSAVNIPISKTNIAPPENVFQTVALVTSTPDKTIIRNLNTITPIPFTAVPFPNPLHPAEIEFGLFELARFRQRFVQENTYLGRIYLPAIEFLITGTKDNINYGFSSTVWYNPTPNSAPKVQDNMTNIQGILAEDSLGIDFNLYADFVLRNFYNFDENKRPRLSIIQVPSIYLSWNSSANRLNTSSATLGYLFILRTPDFGITLSTNLIYTPQGINALVTQTNQGEFGVFINGSFFLNNSLNTRFSLEFGNELFTELIATYPIVKNNTFGDLSLGAYYRNYTSLTRGLGTRIPDSAYGGVIDYTHPHTNFNINTQLGVNERGFDAKLRMGIKFYF